MRKGQYCSFWFDRFPEFHQDPEKMNALLHDLYEVKRLSISQIADKIGVSKSAILNRLHSLKITLQDRGGNHPMKKKVVFVEWHGKPTPLRSIPRPANITYLQLYYHAKVMKRPVQQVLEGQYAA